MAKSDQAIVPILSLRYWELAQKFLRWHYTLYIVAKFSVTNSNLQWRGCGQVGMLTHIVWSCLHLRSFWAEIFKLISKVTGFFSKSNIEQAILGINMKFFHVSVRSVAQQIIMAARSAIMLKWKMNEVPNVREIIRQVNMILQLNYEKILAYKDATVAKYELNC